MKARAGIDEEAQGAIIFVLGVVALRLGVTDAHLAYIQPAMGPFLGAAGAVLAVLGGVMFLRPGRAGSGATADHHRHNHGGGSHVAWLLLAPILAISLVAPAPLGAFAANRAPDTQTAPTGDFGPLPAPTAGAVELPLSEFVGRALHGRGETLRDVPVRLIGFASVNTRGGGFFLTRFMIRCCAADARPVRVVIRGAETPWPAPDTWLEVTGTWHPESRSGEDARPPTLDLIELRVIPPPDNQYL